ncbi:zinc finger protein 33B-like [Rana temporaria]|uniref:zinc finger protein 33B-like n=1 Tax=Rana temporaria TaxID=8407 RepID=UPI001AAD53FB|nr:zinc finger protein 33B-like [Rana temporaria]
MLRMEKDWSHMTERLLNLTLEIIYLLTGEDYGPIKNSSDPPTSSPTPESNNDKNILEVTQKIIDLLTGEVPIRCQDVTVLELSRTFKKIGGDGSSNRNPPERCPRPLYSRDSTQDHQKIPNDHQDEHSIHVKVEITEMEEKCSQTDVQCKKEDFPTDGSSNRNPPERCPHPLYSRDSTQEHQEIPQKGQDEDLIICKVEALDGEETDVRGDELWKEEEIPPEIYTKQHLDTFWDGEIEDDDVAADSTEESILTPTPYPVISSADLSPDPSACGGSFPNACPIFQDTTGGVARSFLCSECGELFTKRAEFISHQRSHGVDKQYACSECGECFTRRTCLLDHQRTHSGQKLFQCAECGKRFTQKSYLLKHQTSHTGEKPFSCSECGKGFIWKSHLDRHQKIHTGEKPFSCLVCGKGFIQTSTLANHLRTHTGEKPYSCEICGKFFTDKSNFLRHEIIHTGAYPYSCNECGRRFIKKSQLKKHGKTHTGLEAKKMQ